MTNVAERGAGVPPARRAGSPPPFVYILLGILLPGAIVLYYVRTFGVNVPVHDEWHFMSTLDKFYAGNEWPQALVDHYGEHRVPVAKAIILALAPFTKYNVKTEMYLSALLMILGAWLCWRLLQRTHAPPWLIIPIGWLFVSTSQFENLLVGWQIQIPLMNVFVLLTILLLSQEPLQLKHEALAAVTALLATFSFANGLLIWPVLILFVAVRTRARGAAVLWTFLTIGAVWLYASGYSGFHRIPGDQAPDYIGTLTKKPVAVAKLFIASVGNNFGAGAAMSNLIAGLVLLLILAVIAYGWRLVRTSDETFSPWVALLLFSMMSAGAIAVGRAHDWRAFATPSRYLSITIFIPIAMLVLGARLLRDVPPAMQRVAVAIAAVLLLAGAWQHSRAVRLGWAIGEANRNQNLNTVPCLVTYRTAPDDCLRKLYARDGAYVRLNARTLERWRLGPFAGLPPTRAELAAEDPDRKRVVEGTVDIVELLPRPDGTVAVKAQGWGLLDREETPAAVALTIDGKTVGQTSAFVNRVDVAQFFNRSLPPAGWTIEGSASLKKGPHRVEAMVLSPTGKVLGTLVPKDVSF